MQEIEIKKILGNNIRLQRQKKNISQTELAKIIGIHQNSISRMEKGDFFANASTLANITKALDISIQDLFSCNIECKSKEALYDENLCLIENIKNDKDKLQILYLFLICLNNNKL